MQTKDMGFFFILFAVIGGVTTALPALADHPTASVSIPLGTSVTGCEETDECFIPSSVTVDVGGEVTWSNDDTAAHTVTSSSAAEGEDANFDSSLFMAGTTFSITFDTEGEYAYFCMVHPWMVGTVVVQEAEGEEMEDEHMEDEHMERDVMIKLNSDPVGQGERMTINIEITDMDGNMVEHVNYNVMATQNGEVVLDDQGVHDHDGSMSHETSPLPAAASGDSPVDVEVEFLGFGIDSPFTGPIGYMEEVQVVPEFGTIAVMILGVAIISIIAVTAKSKVIPRL